MSVFVHSSYPHTLYECIVSRIGIILGPQAKPYHITIRTTMKVLVHHLHPRTLYGCIVGCIVIIVGPLPNPNNFAIQNSHKTKISIHFKYIYNTHGVHIHNNLELFHALHWVKILVYRSSLYVEFFPKSNVKTKRLINMMKFMKMMNVCITLEIL